MFVSREQTLKKMREKKIAAVQELEAELNDYPFFIFVGFSSILAQEITVFRRKLKREGGTFKVVKNTMINRALDQAGLSSLKELVEGPSGIIFCRLNGDNPFSPLKSVENLAREKKEKFVLRAGYHNGALLSPDQLKKLAGIPSTEYLQSKLCGTMVGPITAFLYTLQAIPQKFLVGLTQIAAKAQKEA